MVKTVVIRVMNTETHTTQITTLQLIDSEANISNKYTVVCLS